MRGYTYTELTNALQSWPAKTGASDYLDNLDRIIQNGELQLIKDLNVEIFDRVDTTAVVTAGSPYVTKPTNALATREAYLLTSSLRSRLTQRSLSWCKNYAMNSTTSTGMPKYFAESDELTWYLSPTPLVSATVESHYMIRPASIVDSDTTWLGDHCGELLFFCCLANAEQWLKADDRYVDFMQGYGGHLQAWKLENRNLLRNGDYAPLPAAAQKV